MAMLTRKRLQALLQKTSGPCISLYIPTHRHHPETEQDPIRFKNAIKEAERLLSEHHSAAEIRALLDPVAAIPSLEFWRHQSDALAILRAPEVLEEYRLPISVNELVVVADSFHVRPLIRSINAAKRYFVLAISRGGAELFEGSAGTLIQIEVPGMPKDAAEFASSRRAGGVSEQAPGKGAASRRTSATGRAEHRAENELVPYFRAIDRAVFRSLPREAVPVILASVEYYLPIYRKISRLRHLSEVMIPGSPDAMSRDDLQAMAWPVAEAILESDTERRLEKYRRASERGRSCEQLEEIVRRAKQGRVRRLFVARGVHIWGTIDPTSGRVLRAGTQQHSQNDDILDDVAESVYAYGGEVIAIPLAKMPRAAEVVAELR